MLYVTREQGASQLPLLRTAATASSHLHRYQQPPVSPSATTCITYCLSLVVTVVQSVVKSTHQALPPRLTQDSQSCVGR